MNGLNDPALPGLSFALNREALLELLRDRLPECPAQLELHGLEVSDVRYDPGRRCDLLYRIKGQDLQGGHSFKQMVAGRITPVGTDPSPPPAELAARYAARAECGLRTPWLFLAAARLELQAYPMDPALPWLFDALSESALAQWLDRMWAPRKTRVRRVRIERLGYTPGARAAFAYDVLAESKRTGELELRRLIGKMHGKKPAGRLFAGSWALWKAARDRVDLAPPVGYLGALNLTFQERVPGERLGGLARSPAFTQHARRTARAIALLHTLDFPLSARRTPQEEASVVLRWSAVLGVIRPDLAARIAQLRDQLVRELETRASLAGPVHGDFHHTNVLVHEDRVSIIDLDEMAFGDPLLDVGRFMASTRIPSLRTFGTIHGLADAREAFLAEYLRKNPDSEARARLFEAATLFTAAASAFRTQRPNWSDEVEILLDEAESVFARARSVHSHAKPRAPRSAPATDPRPWILDPVYMRAALAREIDKIYEAEVTSCAIEDEPDDTERVSYRLTGWRHGKPWSCKLEGWLCENGGGRLKRLEMLREALARIPDAPVLPRPIGYLSPIGLLTYEVAVGTPMATLLGSDHGLDAVARLARALAAMHGAELELDRNHSIELEMRSLHTRLTEVRGVQPTLAARMDELFPRVALLAASVPQWRAPTVRALHPKHVMLNEDHVALGKVEDVTLAHPFIDAASILARLIWSGLRRGRSDEALGFVDRFRTEYEAGGGRSLDGLAPFEAGALLRLACTYALREPGDHAPALLVDRATALLAA